MTAKPVAQTSPLFQAVTTLQAKDQLDLHGCASDEKLASWLDQAIQTTQSDTGYAGADTEFLWKPATLLPRTPLLHYNPTSITSVAYIDEDGNPQTVDPTFYSLDVGKVTPEIVLADLSTSWPTVSTSEPNPWSVTYRAGALIKTQVDPEFTQSVLAIVQRLWNQDPDAQDLGNIYAALSGRKFTAYP